MHPDCGGSDTRERRYEGFDMLRDVSGVPVT